MTPYRVLVTGGQASGKSAYAEGLLAAEAGVTYVATGRRDADDAEWSARIERHRDRRPPTWLTLETSDLAGDLGRLRTVSTAVLVDSLGPWVQALLDAYDWQGTPPDAGRQIDDLVAAWRSLPGRAVAVTDEVGLGLVSEHRAGRLFADLLGQVNQAVAAASDEVVLVVAGRPLRL